MSTMYEEAAMDYEQIDHRARLRQRIRTTMIYILLVF